MKTIITKDMIFTAFFDHHRLLALSLITTLFGCDAFDDDEDGGSDYVAQCAEPSTLDLPEGFCATVFATDLGKARHMAVSPRGDVYVAIGDALEGEPLGQIIALRDNDGDGVSDEQQAFSSPGGNDIEWYNGMLYFAQNANIVRYSFDGDELVPSTPPETVVADLPADGDHVNKSITFDLSGKMYINVGSPSNSCQEENRALESPGQDPCPELETRAGVWAFDGDTTDQTFSSSARFATGLRNMVALAVNPNNGLVYGVQNGRDQLFENWPDLYTEEDDKRLPSEEMFLITRGGDYGWPYCYHDPELGKVLAPEYGGDGELVGRCDSTEEPIAFYGAHWAPLGMHFYQGDTFPERYQQGVFVASHGSRFSPNASGNLPGYKVIFQPFENGIPTDDYEVFADGFAGEGRPLPDQAEHRPVAFAEATDGALYLSDDKGGYIWRIYYND